PRTDVLALLARLVDKSLVTSEPCGDEMRYRMLETIRQYAAEKLEASGEAARLGERHALWALGYAGRLRSACFGPDPAPALNRLEAEHDNFRAALRRSLDAGARDTALGLSSALGRFWALRG